MACSSPSVHHHRIVVAGLAEVPRHDVQLAVPARRVVPDLDEAASRQRFAEAARAMQARLDVAETFASVRPRVE